MARQFTISPDVAWVGDATRVVALNVAGDSQPLVLSDYAAAQWVAIAHSVIEPAQGESEPQGALEGSFVVIDNEIIAALAAQKLIVVNT
jgi:hypothetical protein